MFQINNDKLESSELQEFISSVVIIYNTVNT